MHNVPRIQASSGSAALSSASAFTFITEACLQRHASLISNVAPYRVVVADSRTARNGRAIEEIGIYQPLEDPSIMRVDSERVQYWLGVGAQPTEAVAAGVNPSSESGVESIKSCCCRHSR